MRKQRRYIMVPNLAAHIAEGRGVTVSNVPGLASPDLRIKLFQRWFSQ
jgi:hypothetical protein